MTDPVGLRDRAILEVFYSTGIRRHELAGLELFDVEPERGVVTVRLGKGKRDRVVPIGERALGWVARYLDTGRPALAVDDAERALFLSETGGRLVLGSLTNRMRRYVEAARRDLERTDAWTRLNLGTRPTALLEELRATLRMLRALPEHGVPFCV